MKIRKTATLDYSVKLDVGDIICFTMRDGEQVEAMAVKKDGGTMIMCFVDCLLTEYPMNHRATNEGGYEASDLRKTLRDVILPKFPEEIAWRMVPFANGDLLRIPTEKEIFGENRYGLDEPDSVAQWEPMKLRRNRIAFRGLDGEWEWYWLKNPWLRDVADATDFAAVVSHGIANADNSSYAYGVRPVFGIFNP